MRAIKVMMAASQGALALVVALAAGCTGTDDTEPETPPNPDDPATQPRGAVAPPTPKYDEPPLDPLDLVLAPDAVRLGEAQLDLRVGEQQRFWFEKRAGVRYTIGLTGLTGDLDLYTDYRSDLSRSRYQYVSWRYGTEEEQVDVAATQDGRYYILVHGYEAGRGTLQLYEVESTDEVGWPVSWGGDGVATAALLNGGLNWLEGYDYGSSCGYTHHPGLDLNASGGAHADLGLPALAVADGEVVESHLSGWGNLVLIRHQLSTGLEFYSLYGHLDARHVDVGDLVVRGQTIGLIGMTGRVLSPHLHFELRRSGFSAASFPCGQSAQAVQGNYFDPATFIREH